MKKIINGFTFINKKYKELYKTKLKFIFQFFPANIYLFLLFIILCTIIVPKLKNNYTSTYYTGIGEQHVSEIVEKEISQSIDTTNTKEIKALGITFSTYMRKNNSKYILEIKKNDKTVYSKKIDASKLVDNEEVIFKINQKVKKKDKFKYIIKPIKVEEGNGITILKDQNGDYVYKVYEKSKFYKFAIIVSIILLIIFLLINYLINNDKIKETSKMYKVMLIYILLAVFIYPPLFVPDSEFHFNRAYIVSQNSIMDLIKNKNIKYKKEPYNINCLRYGSLNNNYVNVRDNDDVIKCFDSGKEVKQNNKISINNKIPYLISGLGIRIANIFTNSPMILFFMGRLFNALASFLIILYSLKIASKHKRIILLIVMIPVFIQQMCSYSYDSLLNSLCILVIAYLLNFFDEKEKITIKDLIIYTISMAIILSIKLPYVIIGIPIIFLNKDKFHNKRKILYLLILFAVLGATYLLPKLGGNLGFIDVSGSGERGMSLSSLFDIKYTVKLIYNTLKSQGIIYLESFVGSLGWLNGSDMPRLFMYAYLIFLGLIIFSENQYFNTKTRLRFEIILINLLLIGGIFLSLYLSWNMPGSEYIQGVQGRYFYAPVLALMLALIPKKNKYDISDQTVFTFVNLSSLIYLISILYLFY